MAAYSEFTMVRGVLMGGNNLFAIRRATGEKIPCGFPARMIPQVIENIGRRVEVSGPSECTHIGKIISFRVEAIRLLPENPVKFSDMPAVHSHRATD